MRDKNLQDPHDGKSIMCDETLRELLGVGSINILQINKALTKHISPSGFIVILLHLFAVFIAVNLI